MLLKDLQEWSKLKLLSCATFNLYTILKQQVYLLKELNRSEFGDAYYESAILSCCNNVSVSLSE